MHPRVILSVGTFFFSLATGLTVYILIPFLSTLMPPTYAGLVIALGGILAVISFPYLPRLVSHYGAQEIALIGGVIQMSVLLGLAVAPGALAGIVFAVVMIALQPLIAYEFDLLLEATVRERTTVGEVRTIFLTASNLGVCAAPLLLGAILDGSNAYGRIFLAAAAFLVPFIVLFAARSLPKGVPPKVSELRETLKHIWRDPDLTAITFAHFLLYLFSSWAPLYVPLYLHNVLGIPWGTLGWMFFIMLIPYVLIEYPAGWLADRYIGDKDLLFGGFILSGGALATFSILSPSSSLTFIFLLLILSRIGAALIESMTEGHFFRRVASDDIGSVSFFRGVWPLANIIGPLIGSLILYFGNYNLFFLITGGFIALAGVLSASRITNGT